MLGFGSPAAFCRAPGSVLRVFGGRVPPGGMFRHSGVRTPPLRRMPFGGRRGGVSASAAAVLRSAGCRRCLRAGGAPCASGVFRRSCGRCFRADSPGHAPAWRSTTARRRAHAAISVLRSSVNCCALSRITFFTLSATSPASPVSPSVGWRCAVRRGRWPFRLHAAGIRRVSWVSF